MNAMLAENILGSDYFNDECLCVLRAAARARLRVSPSVTESPRAAHYASLETSWSMSTVECVMSVRCCAASRFLPARSRPWHARPAEPWSQGTARHPSTAFCLLMRLFVYRLTQQELEFLVTHQGSPLVRAMGFLYVRFGLYREDTLWEWFAPYLDDPEVFAPGADKAITMCVHVQSQRRARLAAHASPRPPTLRGRSRTIGDFVNQLLKEPKYFGTVLPRIPVPKMRQIQVKVSRRADLSGRSVAWAV